MGLFNLFKKKSTNELEQPPGFYKGYYIAKQEGKGIKLNLSQPQQSSQQEK